jgi:hypothetical protein
MRMTLLGAAELTAEQSSLFPEFLEAEDDSPTASAVSATAERLSFARKFIGRYGSPAFLQIEAVDEDHPVVERRARLSAITAMNGIGHV